MELITGNTFPVKEQLKALGGHWDSVNKGWLVPDDKAERARSLVNGAGPKKAFVSTAASKTFHNRSGRCKGCHGPIRDAPHHRAMHGYCGNCAFDEFDC